MGVIIILVLIISLVISLVMATNFELAAELKGYDKSKNMHIFALCFFCGIPAYLYVIALPDLNARPKATTNVLQKTTKD